MAEDQWQQDLDHLAQMMTVFRTMPEIYQPSPFWERLVEEHVTRLERWGFENFKRTVNTQYFNWDVLGILWHQIFPVWANWLKRPDWSVFGSEIRDYDQPRGPWIASMSASTAWIYKMYVVMLAQMVQRHDPRQLFDLMQEPLLGNPWRVRYQDRWISQDLCNSIHEFYCASDSEPADPAPASIAELGPGYGRLAYVFLKAFPTANYCLIDIPPALLVSQKYLTDLFPDEKIFHFRPFDNFEAIRAEYEQSRIRFLMAHQIELLPDREFDLIINISSLHEMTREQIGNSLRQFARLGRGRFYTKQWKRSIAPGNTSVIRQHEYPIPESWRMLWHRPHPIQKKFFHALYDVR